MWVDLRSEEMVEPLKDVAIAIVKQIQDVLEETPPELIGDIYNDGIVLTGGASQIVGMDTLIKIATDLRVTIADDPADCVVRGCGEAIKYIDGMKRSDGSVNPITDRF